VSEKEYRCLLVSDFTMDNLAACLENERDFPKVRCAIAPFGQVVQVLIDTGVQFWDSNPDFAVIWTQPHNIIESFQRFLDTANVPVEEILKEVDHYSKLLMGIQNRVRFILVPTWVCPSYDRGYGMLDMRSKGLANTLMRMNLRLAENLEHASNIFLLDTQRWTNTAGKNAFNPKLWYMAKIAFGREVFVEAARDMKAALRAMTAGSRKLLIVDLDGTLWGGIVGDDGWENLKLGGHDYVGEAYRDFQRSLKSLKNRGILLGIVSKNDETIALEAIKRHPEMVLRLDDFAGWRINWSDKAENVVDLVTDLNLGLQSVVFIDDNPAERARVRDALPEVLVPEWPEDKMLYRATLLSLRCFDTSSIGKEDLERTSMYVAERQRRELKSNLESLDEWLTSLETEVRVEELTSANLQRVAQLMNRTNQMNLSTRRMTETEILNWAAKDNHKLWTFSVSDKFGQSGLTGVASLEVENRGGRIVDFVLSCRVMGRKIEETMLHVIVEHARSIGLDYLYAKYIPTKKNNPCLEFWQRSGWEYDAPLSTFKWQLGDQYPLPNCINIK